MEIHVVSKVDNCQHATVSVGLSDTPSKAATSDEGPAAGISSGRPQEDLTITARPILLSLTSNNLSYARSGDILHWWDAYPIPLSAPHPYCDSSAWGIVPAWGYAVVLTNSRPSTLPPGAILWGFWPTADMPVGLKLQASHQSAATWTECSGHRQKMMRTYNVYTEKRGVAFPPPISSSLTLGETQLKDLAWETLFRPTWQSGYLLSQHVFPPSAAAATPAAHAIPPVHPLGMGGVWSRQDGDLSRAIVISLAASGKTAQSFAYNIFRRPSNTGPLGLLQVTSTPRLISTAAGNGAPIESRILTKTVSYAELGPDLLEWMQECVGASRIVIVDFGARGNALEELLGLVADHTSLQTLQMTIVQVGNEQKVYTNQEMQATKLAFSKLGKLQFNSSAVRDTAIRYTGEEAFHDHFRPVWEDWLRRSHDLMSHVQIKYGEGISGHGGIEKGWERLSKGLVGAEEGLVYRIRLASEGDS